MNILVACPMHSEYSNFRRALSSFSSTKHSYKVLEVGVGKVNAATSVALELFSPKAPHYDMLLLCGYAGATPYFHQGDIVVPSSTKYHDLHLPDGVDFGIPSFYNLLGSDECPILSGDAFVTPELSQILKKIYGPILLFDMEAMAIAQILDQTDTPMLVIKYVSDIPEKPTDVSFDAFVKSHSDFRPFITYIESI